MITIGIILVKIVVIILAIHFVCKKSFKHGVAIGRQQILEEDIIRAAAMQHELDENLRRTAHMLTEAEPTKIKPQEA